jgi:hypothetical protein
MDLAQRYGTRKADPPLSLLLPRFRTASRGLKPIWWPGLDVRAKARTYLRSNSNRNNGEKQIPFGEDNKKDNSNCFPRVVLR